jgi:hypothetical protein
MWLDDRFVLFVGQSSDIIEDTSFIILNVFFVLHGGAVESVLLVVFLAMLLFLEPLPF